MLPLVSIVAQRQKSKIYCSGTLIDPYLILTAAHCFTHKDIIKTTVRMRDPTKPNNLFLEHAVEKYFLDPDYTLHSWEAHDIALVKLRVPFDKDSVVADLPPLNYDDYSYWHYGPYYVAGYGWIDDKNKDHLPKSHDHARFFRLRPMEMKHTGAENRDEDYRLTAEEDRGAVCFGDSGGPVLAYVAGSITVFGIIVQGSETFENPLMKQEFEEIGADKKKSSAFLKNYPEHRRCHGGEQDFVEVGFHREWIGTILAKLKPATRRSQGVKTLPGNAFRAPASPRIRT